MSSSDYHHHQQQSLPNLPSGGTGLGLPWLVGGRRSAVATAARRDRVGRSASVSQDLLLSQGCRPSDAEAASPSGELQPPPPHVKGTVRQIAVGPVRGPDAVHGRALPSVAGPLEDDLPFAALMAAIPPRPLVSICRGSAAANGLREPL
ncbi:hypothetical protein CDD83_8466 [Cordyceps sp. RAO-2017]|nr:hypothetical protein CDD83_8466 [Cordyceps sp. RAO-2017]